ncbi:unnamed protein product [Auanema sp. JU1783]|nr:unnamed protein product [Auanema sp. JU1783]
MEMYRNDFLDDKYLDYNAHKPSPLPDNFHLKLITLEAPSLQPLDKVFVLSEPNSSRLNTSVSTISEQILKKVDSDIKEAAAKIAASSAISAVNREGAIFEDLVPISFDEADFIRKQEDILNIKRSNLKRKS